MYRTAEHVTGKAAASPGFPLELARIAHRRFAGGTQRIDDPFSVRHFSDLTGGHGVTYRRDIAERAAGNSFTTMAMDLLDSVILDGDPIELAVVAHVTPDIDCRLAATTYLSHVLPGCALAFAVSDCGMATPYTALRLAGAYARRHDYRRALVLLVDQATLPYDVPGGTAPAGDAAIGILLARGGPTGIGLQQLAGVRPAAVPTAVDGLLDAVAGPDEPIAVIAGAGIDPDRDLPERCEAVWCAPAGYPCTATWEGLARHIGACAGGRVVLVDYDRTTGDLCACAVDRPWSTRPAPDVRDAA